MNTLPELTNRELIADLQAERARTRALEAELARARSGADAKMEELSDLLQQVLTGDKKFEQFDNPALSHLAFPETARCWIHDSDCARAPELDEFAERMKVCASCDAFKRVAPDAFTRAGELVNAILFLLEQRNDLFRSAQEQLIQSERLAGLGELAAGLAHEINTPTGIILARLDCIQLEQGAELGESLRDDLEVIRRHADRLGRITSSLTSFARRHKIEKRPAVLQDLLRELLNISERMVSNGNVALSSQMPDHPMLVFADSTLIQQVFMNLIINARDAMPEGGHLDICGWIEGGNCIMEFRDTGTGMSEEVRKRVFDPFFSTKEEKGTGLGLSVSYGIVKDHGGRIEVDSELGAGSIFRITLPEYSEPPRLDVNDQQV